MGTPVFLSKELVLKLHEYSLALYGGAEGIRDDGLVESALGAAQNTFFYGHGDIFAIAAFYAFHIAEAQAFFDGNKRTAIASALAFLAGNGIQPPVSNEMQIVIYDAMIAIAEKRLDKTGLATLFREIFR